MTVFLFLLTYGSVLGQVEIIYPSDYIVIQRSNQNEGTVYISGTLSQMADRVEARLLAISGEADTNYDTWVTIDGDVQTGSFLGHLVARGGRYNLEVRAVKDNLTLGSVSVVEKVGVGEVFLIVGHSNAEWGPESPSHESNRVVSMNPNVVPDFDNLYKNTGNPEALPKVYTPLTPATGMAPFAGVPFFWGRFGDLVVEEFGVPVLLYSAAFGGSSMEQTRKSAYGLQFDHGFIRWDLRMPYINIENALFHLVPKTGIRAVLSGHGVNDAGEAQKAAFYDNYSDVIAFSRATPKLNDLTWMIAKACYKKIEDHHDYGSIIPELAAAQENLLADLSNVFRGANLNSIGDAGRRDDHLHFNGQGAQAAAELWRDAVSQSDFLENSTPIMPESPDEPEGSLPVTLVNFDGQETETGAIRLIWSTSEEKDNSHFEVQYSSDARSFKVAGTVAGAVNTSGVTPYNYMLPGPFYSENVYLRLKQVDLDGSFAFSNVISVKATAATQYGFYPNPSAGVFEFRSAGQEIPRLIQVYDQNGILLIEAHHTNRIDLGNLPSSLYVAVVDYGAGLHTVKRILKQ